MWAALVTVGIVSSVPYFPNFKPDIIILPTAIFGPFFIWLGVFNLSVTDTEISYKTLLGGVRKVNRQDITRYKITVGDYESSEDRTKPFIRLCIFTKESTKKPSLEINLKVFGYNEMQPFFDLLDSGITKNNP